MGREADMAAQVLAARAAAEIVREATQLALAVQAMMRTLAT